MHKIKPMRIGIIKETKTPPDSRVLLTPTQCKALISKYPSVEILVQPSPSRSYKDEEYTQAGITLKEDLSDCDVLIGIQPRNDQKERHDPRLRSWYVAQLVGKSSPS